MSRNEFINELMEFTPKNMSESQIDAIEQFCFGLYDDSDISTLRTQLAKANERVKELESESDLKDVKIIDLQHQVGTLEFNQVTPNDLDKFAIEKKIDLLSSMVYSSSDYLFNHNKLDICTNHLDILLKNFCNYHREQLRKEQE
mgnify:CR=1 FL=1